MKLFKPGGDLKCSIAYDGVPMVATVTDSTYSYWCEGFYLEISLCEGYPA